jgi:hypothetical protein
MIIKGSDATKKHIIRSVEGLDTRMLVLGAPIEFKYTVAASVLRGLNTSIWNKRNKEVKQTVSHLTSMHLFPSFQYYSHPLTDFLFTWDQLQE